MSADPKLDAVIDVAVRAALTAAVGWEEQFAEPYLAPIRDAVLAAIAKAGYVVKKGK